METTHTITENSGVFNILENQEIIGELTYSLPEDRPGVLVANHTMINSSHRGKGIGEVLIKKLIEWVEEKQYKIKPTCSFVVKYFERHPELSHLLVEIKG